MSQNGDLRSSALGAEDLRARVAVSVQSARRTSALAHSIEEGIAGLQSSGNEQAAMAEQVRTAVEAVAAGIEETAASALELGRSQQSVADSAKSVREALDGSSASFQELAASVPA